MMAKDVPPFRTTAREMGFLKTLHMEREGNNAMHVEYVSFSVLVMKTSPLPHLPKVAPKRR